MKIEFYRHNLGPDEIASIVETLNGTFLTSGPKTRQFEQELASYLGVRLAMGFTSWTMAAFLVLKAWEIGPGDEVIVPAMTFASSANIVLHCGARVVFVDVEPETGNIDVDAVARAITPRTKAIVPVHLYGQMVDMRGLRAVTEGTDIKILEDSAHCIEGTRDGYRPGQLGDAAAFSFYATKNLTCGEGGAVVTNDEELIRQLMLLRLHGMSKSAADRYTKRYSHYDIELLGYKANMFDIQATLLVPQLPKLKHYLTRREAICSGYEKAFMAHEIEFPKVLPGSRSARHIFTLWAPRGRRDDWMARLQEKEIGVAVNFRPVHLFSYYRDSFGYQAGDYPVAEEIGERTITIPMYPRMTDDEVDYVIDSVLEVARIA